MKRNRRRLYWVLGAVVVTLVVASAATTVAYSKWRVGESTLAPEHTAVTLVQEREEVRDGKAKYTFEFDIIFPKDCEFTLVGQTSNIPEGRWHGRGDTPGRKPPRSVRLVVAHLYDPEKGTTEITEEMVSTDAKKELVHKSAATFGPKKTEFVVAQCKPNVALLSGKPSSFPVDLLVISTQNAKPGPTAEHQLLTLLRVSGPGGSVPEVGEAELDVIAREYRMGGAKNGQ